MFKIRVSKMIKVGTRGVIQVLDHIIKEEQEMLQRFEELIGDKDHLSVKVYDEYDRVLKVHEKQPSTDTLYA